MLGDGTAPARPFEQTSPSDALSGPRPDGGSSVTPASGAAPAPEPSQTPLPLLDEQVGAPVSLGIPGGAGLRAERPTPFGSFRAAMADFSGMAGWLLGGFVLLTGAMLASGAVAKRRGLD